MRNRDAILITVAIVIPLLIVAIFTIPRPAIDNPASTGTTTDHASQTASPAPTAKPTAPPVKKTPAPSSTPRPATIVTPRHAATPGTGRKSLTPEPDTGGFYHPEDFYDWYKDDYIDYEDAENYYYSHGGW